MFMGTGGWVGLERICGEMHFSPLHLGTVI